MTKTELRQIYVARQKAISPLERDEKSRRIARCFFESVDLSNTKLLHCFIPIEKFNEVDTSLIIRAIWKSSPKTKIVVPRINFETAEMESLAYTAETELVKNKWGIREPVSDESAEPAMIDIILVPGIVFDRAGHRVGYGKGFYDRFLKRCRKDCVKIGLTYFEPQDEIADVHEGDTALDFWVTPERIFNAETRRRGDWQRS